MTKRHALQLTTKLCSTILPSTNKAQCSVYTCFIPRAIWFNPCLDPFVVNLVVFGGV